MEFGNWKSATNEHEFTQIKLLDKSFVQGKGVISLNSELAGGGTSIGKSVTHLGNRYVRLVRSDYI